MMGRLKSDQGQLFYEFCLGDAVPEDHLVRKIDAALDLTWLRSELAPHYSSIGRPSIDPELMIRMLVVGYVFATRSERLICREVQVNLAYRWFCKLGIEDVSRINRRFRVPATSASAKGMFSVRYSSGSSRHASRPAWLVAKVLQSMRA
jgi:transposase